MQDLYVHTAHDNHHLNSCRRKPAEEMTQYCVAYMVTKLHRTNIDLDITRIKSKQKVLPDLPIAVKRVCTSANIFQ